MPLTSRKNQYIGINAHFQSFAQAYALWNSFHSAHLNDIAVMLDAALSENYLVRVEDSMQIRYTSPEAAAEGAAQKTRSVRPDVSILYTGQSASRSSGEFLTPTLAFPAVETSDDPAIFLRAISIRPYQDNVQGSPVVWIELLSPANKPGGSGYRQYIEKRRATLDAGIVLVEMDYLHESAPVNEHIPDYSRHQAKAFPFMLLLTDPRPDLSKAETMVYGFRVETPVPKLIVPLVNEDTVTIDFDTAYQNTYRSLRAFSADVDYSQPPVNLERYDKVDAARIRARMQTVMDASARGLSLDDAPFPLLTLPEN